MPLEQAYKSSENRIRFKRSYSSQGLGPVVLGLKISNMSRLVRASLGWGKHP
jgi:hypothetical protein